MPPPLNTKIGLSTPIFILTLIFLPIMGYVMQQLQKTDAVPPPPADFGSGSMFDQIATRYDFINRILALRMDVSWRTEMTRRIQEKLALNDNGDISTIRVLDVATGTADVALQLAKDIPDATILGVDPSHNMLQVGRDKIAECGLSHRIELVRGDARYLSSQYSADTFDAATMAFGIRNVPEREVALCEIHRLLKPSGILAILEFSEPDDSHGLLGYVARYFIRHIVPFVGGVLSGAPQEYRHLQNSIQDFPSPPKFRELMQTLSCNNGDDDDGNTFEMDPIVHMNFGSVQLYMGTAIKVESSRHQQSVQHQTK